MKVKIMKKEFNIILIILIVATILTSFIIFQIIDNKNRQIAAVETILVQEATSHFENVVMTRQWNAQFGGVYVKKNDSIEPNPYLIDNHTYSKDNELLIKINPAWMTRQISEISNKQRNFYFKITSLNPINPNNKADKFEEEALHFFENNKSTKFYYTTDTNKDLFNFMGSLTVTKACLKCHAEQGYTDGDIRGGIRLSIPIKSHNAKINQIKKNALSSIFLVVATAIFVTLVLVKFMLVNLKKQKEIEQLNENLEKRVKEEINKNQEKEKLLSQQSKMAALGEMMSNIAHQWRQPLSAITSATSGMQLQKEMDTLTDSDFDRTTEQIIEHANYMSQTIDDFRTFFQKDKEAEVFTLHDLIANNISLIQTSLSSKDISLQIDEIDKNITLRGFSSELVQALLNILNNAKDQLLLNGNKTRYIHIANQMQGNEVVVTISDTAGGIPEDIIEKVFEPYFTTKHQSQGTGIGLYMVAEIIRKHFKGSIKVYNHEILVNKKKHLGACFEIRLPMENDNLNYLV